jgi:prenylcysteine oxidase/farnesylcysteine lyase
MELFISTMETNALMGKNVAKLIVDDIACGVVNTRDGQRWGDEQKVLN